jgi:predicted DNA-binding mobile mystery protein A
MKSKALQREQLNRKMQQFNSVASVPVPPEGWIRAIRTSLGMSMQQLGNRLGVTRQNINDVERREQEGAITIRNLREIGDALDMKLIYAFVPNDGTLDALIERKARELAEKIVLRTDQNMRLESQENTADRLEWAIRARADELRRETPRYLWD